MNIGNIEYIVFVIQVVDNEIGLCLVGVRHRSVQWAISRFKRIVLLEKRVGW